MTDKELLEVKLKEAKSKLEEKGFFLGEEGELMDLFPSMKQYEYAFQAAIEDIWPDKAWWQVTNYWDIFQDSIMSGKKADEVIQDILDHIVEDDEEIKVEKDSSFDIDDDFEESLEEKCEECKVSDSIFELVKDLDEGE